MNSEQEALPDSDVAFHTFIGVVVSLCGNVLISIALNVQKLAHNVIQEKQMAKYFANMDEPPRWISTSHNNYSGDEFFPDDGYSSPRPSIEETRRSPEEELEHQKFIMAMAQEQTKGGDVDYLRSKLWWLGISLMVLGEVGNFVAYGFAPASTIAPLGTTTLVSNVILAPMILKEPFRKRDFLGVVLAVTGAAMVVMSSNAEEAALSPEIIAEAMTQTRSLIYFVITGIAIIALTVASPLYGSSSIMIDLGLVAIYGGYTVLCTKSVASLLSLSFFKMFTYLISYLLIATLAITAVLQIKYLNKALQRFDSTEVIPTQFVLFTVSAIVGSAVLYHDFDDMSLDQSSRFMTGCAVEFLGVYLITSKREKRLPPIRLHSDDTVTGFASNAVADSVSAINRTSVDEEPNQLDDHFGQGSHYARRSIPSNALQQHAHTQPHGLPYTFRSSFADEWDQQQFHQHHNASNDTLQRRRRSSIFRGISLTSQLVDRMHEESPQTQHSSPSNRNSFASLGNRRSDSSVLGHLISGFTGVAHSADEDAVEIDVPTASHLDTEDRELVTLIHPEPSSKRNSARLVDVEQGASFRDLN